MTISAIIAEWGALYRKGQATLADLLVKLREKSETEAIFPVRFTESTVMEKSIAAFSRVLQRFQKDFTPVGGVTFTPTKIQLYRLKIDASEYPDELVESWLGFLADEGLDRKKWPFVKWWLENILLQAAEDLEKNEIFAGVTGSITPGTATAAGASMVGIRKQIRDGVTAGTMNNIASGAVPTDAVEFVNYVEDYFKSIPELLRNEMDMICMRRELRDLFKEGMREKYNTQYLQVTDRAKVVDTNVEIKGLLSHAGSDMIWCSPKWNRQRGLKAPQNENIFQVESDVRNVKAFTDYWKGVGFWIPQYLYTNGEDLV